MKSLRWIGMVTLVVGCNAAQYGVSVEPKEAEKNIKVRMPNLGGSDRDPAAVTQTDAKVDGVASPTPEGELVANGPVTQENKEPVVPAIVIPAPVELKECPIEDDVTPRKPFVLPQVTVGVNISKTPSTDAAKKPISVDVGVNKDGQKGVQVGVNVFDKVTVGVQVKPPVQTPTPAVAKVERTDCIKVGKLVLSQRKMTIHSSDGLYEIKFNVSRNPNKFDANDVLESATHAVTCTTPQSRLPIPVGISGKLSENNQTASFKVPAQYIEGQECYFRLVGKDQSHLNRAVTVSLEKAVPSKKEAELSSKYQLLDASTGYQIKVNKNVGADAKSRVRALMAALIQKNPTLSESLRKTGFQVFVSSKAEKAADLKLLTKTTKPTLAQMADGAHLILGEDDLVCTDQERIAGIQVLRLLARSIYAHLDQDDRRILSAIQSEVAATAKDGGAAYLKDPIAFFSHLTGLWAEACVHPDGSAKELTDLPPQAGALVKDLYGNCELVEPLACRK